MGQGFLIDSNVTIDYIGSRFSSKASDFVEVIFDQEFLISIVVKIEVLGFNDTPTKTLQLEHFIEMALVLSLNDYVTDQAIDLRRQYRKLKLGDAIIAATALVHNLALLTRNTADFKQIVGLDLLDPYTL